MPPNSIKEELQSKIIQCFNQNNSVSVFLPKIVPKDIEEQFIEKLKSADITFKSDLSACLIEVFDKGICQFYKEGDGNFMSPVLEKHDIEVFKIGEIEFRITKLLFKSESVTLYYTNTD
jgi:hypothetical protein